MLREFDSMKRLFSVAKGEVSSDNPRESIYHELVYNRFEDFIRTSFPLFSSFVGSSLEPLVREFLSLEHRSPLLLSLGEEFLRFFKGKKTDLKERYPFLEELLLHEWLEIELFNAPDESPSETFSWEERYRLSSTARLLELEYPVHKGEGMTAEELAGARGKYHLLLYRGPNDDVRSVELTGFVFSFLRELCEGADPLEALEGRNLGDELELVRSYLDKFLGELVSLGVLVKR
ncbi:HvfC/BufC family peptide modification chaperone [Hydrogenivirga sp.]